MMSKNSIVVQKRIKRKSRVHFVQNSLNGKVRLIERKIFQANVTHNMCDSLTGK